MEVACLKPRRQMRILDLIRQHIIETQEELAEQLRQDGISVTQATVSRDIKDLKLVKVPVGDGRYRYALPEDQSQASQVERMLRLMRECVVNVDYSENLLVLMTLPATAAVVAEAIDGLRWPEIIGSLAGERNVFAVVKPKSETKAVAERLRELIR